MRTTLSSLLALRRNGGETRTVLASRTAMFLSGMLLGLTQCHADNMAVACSRGVSAPCSYAEGGDSALSLLQNRAAAKRNDPNQNQAELEVQQKQRLENAKPILWVHVPECGATFLNVLAQHPGICPGATPKNTIMNETGPMVMNRFHEGLNFQEACPSAFVDPDNLLGWYDGIGTNYDRYNLEGHLMTVLRHPKSRLISAYRSGKHSWPGTNRMIMPDRNNISLTEYVEMMQGHFVKTLVRDYSTLSEDVDQHDLDDKYHVFHDRVTAQEMMEANRRLNVGFAFVGILEEWPLSMCLFHKMFGGQCVEAEFRHIHAGGDTMAKHLQHLQQMKELEGFEDPYDTPLYKQAVTRFHADLTSFDVSAATCQECFAAAGYDPKHEKDV